jgi:hypothetical protein
MPDIQTSIAVWVPEAALRANGINEHYSIVLSNERESFKLFSIEDALFGYGSFRLVHVYLQIG